MKKENLYYIYVSDWQKDSLPLFYVVENGAKEFSKLDRESFIMQYDCFDKDLEKSDGIRPWEEGSKEVAKDLAQSSGKVLPASKGDKNVEELKNEQEGDER